jgi:cytochrome c-type biogenesis protein CcmH/NrfG
VALLEKRVADQPADAIAGGKLAAIYQREGQVDKAAAQYEAVLKSSPNNLRALVELARLYSARPQQQAKAFELAKAAYKVAPEDPRVGRLLGRLAYQTGDFKWSLDLLQEASRQLRPGIVL